MASNKRLIAAGAAAGASGGFDPLQNFETVTYTGNGGTQKITGYIRKGAAFSSTTSEISGVKSIDEGESMSFWLHRPPTGSGNLRFQTQSSATYSYFAFIFRELADGSFQVRSYFRNDISNYRFYYSVSNITLSTDWVLITWNQPSVSELNSADNLPTRTLTVDGVDVPLYRQSNGGTLTSIVQDTPKFGVSFVSSYSYSPVGIKYDQIRYFNTHLTSSNITDLKAETYADATKSTTDFFGNGTGVALYQLDEDANDTGVPIDSGQSGVFNGSSSVITLPSALSDGVTTTAQTISFWFYVENEVTSSTSNNEIMTFAKSSSNDGKIALGSTTGNFAGETFSVSSDVANQYSYIKDTIPAGWNHAVVQWETNKWQIYINGSSKTVYTFGTNQQGNWGLKFGNRSIFYFNGKLDDIRIYSDQLTSGEINAIFNNTTASIPTDYLAYYKLDGDATDETTNYNGTASNVTYSDPAILPTYNGTPTNVNFLGMAFKPDLVWIKNRDASYSHMLYDSIRLAGNDLSSDTTGTGVVTGLMTSFDTNGFTVVAGGSNRTNFSSEDYVAWCWKASDTTVTDSSTGDITADIRANTAAGFSIVKYTGNLSTTTTATGASVPHGLNSPLELILVKNLDTAENWWVSSSELDNWSTNLHLNESDAKDNIYSTYPIADPTADVFYTNYITALNVLNDNYIAYCFHSVDGYQKIGTYTTGASTKITTGFEPRFLIIKYYGATSNWFMMDTVRYGGETGSNGGKLVKPRLLSNSSAAEASVSSGAVEIMSDGFYPTNFSNSNGVLYLAIA